MSPDPDVGRHNGNGQVQLIRLGNSIWLKWVNFTPNTIETIHYAHLPVAVASRLTCDLGVTAWGSTSGSCSFCWSVSMAILRSVAGVGAGAT